LRFKTISFFGPEGSYDKCVDWLKNKCSEFGECEVKTYVEGRPNLVVTIPGKQPELKSILLNSHIDVVPCDDDKWNWDPFAADMDEEGNIYARGSQDMKCVCMQYIHAMRRLKKAGVLPCERTIHMTFVPDEEIANGKGMACLIKDEELMKKLNIGFAFDEGLANPGNLYTIFYGERSPQWLRVVAKGPAGHGSRFVPDTATIKLIECVNEFLKFRKEQEAILDHAHKNCIHKTLGDVTTVNLTMLKSGVTFDGGNTYALNVIPTRAEAGFDVRVSPHFPMKEWDDLLAKWTADEQLSVEMVMRTSSHKVSTTDPKDPFWKCFNNAMNKLGVEIKTEIFPAATDSRFLRENNIPCYGFSPMRNTPILLHDHNEFLNKDVYKEGISMYEAIIPAMGNLGKNDLDKNLCIACPEEVVTPVSST